LSSIGESAHCMTDQVENSRMILPPIKFWYQNCNLNFM
jgi:hypothetical protein